MTAHASKGISFVSKMPPLLGHSPSGSDHLTIDPDGDGGKFDEAHEVGEQLVVAGGDAPEL